MEAAELEEAAETTDVTADSAEETFKEYVIEVPAEGESIEEAVIPAMARVASEAQRERVREVVRDVIYPAETAYLAVLRREYLPATRVDPGLGSAPDGEAIYRTPLSGRRSFLDTDVASGQRIRYAVVANGFSIKIEP